MASNPITGRIRVDEYGDHDFYLTRRPDVTWSTVDKDNAGFYIEAARDNRRVPLPMNQGFGYVMEWKSREAIDNVSEWTFTFRPTGAPPIPLGLQHKLGNWKGIDVAKGPDMVRILIDPPILELDGLKKRIERAMADVLKAQFTMKEKKPMKIRNRFYIAADAMLTEKEQAQPNVASNVPLAGHVSTPDHRWSRPTLAAALEHAEYILETDPRKEQVAIVQIVRIVRRKKAPIVVEIVK